GREFWAQATADQVDDIEPGLVHELIMQWTNVIVSPACLWVRHTRCRVPGQHDRALPGRQQSSHQPRAEITGAAGHNIDWLIQIGSGGCHLKHSCTNGTEVTG